MTITIPPTRAATRTKRTRANTAPVNFDPATHPILSRHWFGVEPLCPIGQFAVEAVAGMRFRRQVQRLHALGPRVTAELLAEIGAERSIQTVIDQKLDRYAQLEPEALAMTGGDDFWQPPLHGVDS